MSEREKRKQARSMLSKMGYRSGGHHSPSDKREDEVSDKHMIVDAIHEHEDHDHPGTKKTRLRLKDGGLASGHRGKHRGDRKSRGKPHTQVNVLVGGHGQPKPVPVPVPVPAGAGGPPPGGPPMPPPGMDPGMGGPPPGIGGPPMGQKRGGRAHYKKGGRAKYDGGGKVMMRMNDIVTKAGTRSQSNKGYGPADDDGGYKSESSYRKGGRTKRDLGGITPIANAGGGGMIGGPMRPPINGGGSSLGGGMVGSSPGMTANPPPMMAKPMGGGIPTGTGGVGARPMLSGGCGGYRKGGRVEIDDGAGGGAGRLEKAKAYGAKTGAKEKPTALRRKG